MKDYINEELMIIGEKSGELRNEEGVEEKLNLLINKFNDMRIGDDNALNAVSYVICCFENIQPFTVGSGQVARLVLNYLLITNNLPPIVIFYNDKDEYYLSLKHFKETKHIDKMTHFLEDQAYKTWIKDYNLKLKNLRDFLN